MNMLEKIRLQIDELIEKELAKYLSDLSKIKSVKILIGEFVEQFYKQGNFGRGEHFRPALEVLIPKIIDSENFSDTTDNLDEQIGIIVNACEFANHYYAIRDLIYYSFSIPNSIDWICLDDCIDIQVKDPSIFRQLASEIQSFATNSNSSSHPGNYKATIGLLQGTEYWDTTSEKVQETFELIEREVDMKILHFFSYIPFDSQVDIGGYKYEEFFKIYRCLLYISLYERYYSAANKISSVIIYNEALLVQQLSDETNINNKVTEKILSDISSSSRNTFIYLSQNNEYLLFSFSFSLKDGIGGILKQFAQKNSDDFSTHCGLIIGDSLVKKISSYFSDYRNFKILNDVLLKKFDTSLPDIDVLAISYEPSLGFHFFVAEVKNSLPATWAKDHLKSTGKKGFIKKAISQVNKLDQFFNTVEGQVFLKDMSLKAFPNLDMDNLFPSGFCIVMDYLIVTSQSIGMFFPEQKLTIICDDIFRDIVRKSDGDTNFIKYYLSTLNESLDSIFEIEKTKITIDNINISYHSPVLKHIITIPMHQYLSINELENLEKSSLETGYRYIDSISKA